MDRVSPPAPGRGEKFFATLLLLGLLFFAVWAVSVGFGSRALHGNAFRQAQTAMTAMFVQRDHDFSLAYPTPILGKPWSIPFEFPLYQWTVAVTSDVTGLSLIKSARLVSAVCFFLALPAVWLLCGRMGFDRSRRVVVMAMVLTCPLLLFYARAFLIETMALLFALWFLQAFVAAVEKRSWAWLVLANLAGIGAGLVKVTTFMVYLVPAVAWGVWWLWRAWRENGAGARARALGRIVGWSAAAVALPFAATYWWIGFSDAVKALNPSSRNLVSAAMHGYNFGNRDYRADPAIWAAHWRTFSVEILPWSTLLAIVAVGLLVGGGRRLWWAVGCAVVFLLAPATFPVLYAWHEYYFTAVAVLPMVAAGLVLGGLFETAVPRWRTWAVVLAFCAMQVHVWWSFHRPLQVALPGGSNDLAEALRYTTESDSVVVVAGEDWGAITPFYAQRRALMLRRAMESDWAYVQEAFGYLAGERIAALVLRGAQRENARLVELATEMLGIDPRVAFRWQDADVYLPQAVETVQLHKVAQLGLPEITLCRADLPPPPEGAVVWTREYMTHRHREALAPLGVGVRRFTSRFGIHASEVGGVPMTSAHPVSRIWLDLPAGRHAGVLSFRIADGAYSGLPFADATDGVEFVVAATDADGGRRVLHSRLLSPRDSVEDRGWQQERVELELRAGEELVLETLSGPANNGARDWAGWGPLTFKTHQ